MSYDSAGYPSGSGRFSLSGCAWCLIFYTIVFGIPLCIFIYAPQSVGAILLDVFSYIPLYAVCYYATPYVIVIPLDLMILYIYKILRRSPSDLLCDILERLESILPIALTILCIIAVFFYSFVNNSISDGNLKPLEAIRLVKDISNHDLTVYWTSDNDAYAYHYDKNCQALSNVSIILSGTMQDAINATRTNPCDFCIKN